MANLIENTIEKYNMLEYGDTVIVALSGGADSVCLLHNLNSIKEKYNLNLMACHVNHNLRGKESDKDMKFCMELCRQNNIEIFVKNADVDAISREQKLSHEECGRNVRYEYFTFLSQKYNGKIATAHNADDNVETVIYNMTRGASLRGLSGIPKVRGKIIRPLLFSSREEIEEYCRKYNLMYMTDSTNLTDEYTRNKIRHRVIPVLKEINPSVENTVFQMNSTLSEIAEYLEKNAHLLLKIAKCSDGYLSKKLNDANAVVLKEAIAILFAENGFTSYSSKQIEETLSVVQNGGKINIRKNLSAVNKQGVFRIVALDNDDFYTKRVVPDKPVVYKNRLFTLDTVKIKGKFEKYTSNNYISGDIMSDELTLRNRLAGDTIKLNKRGVTKSLKKLMNELKIPEEQRDKLLVLAKGNEVYWGERIGISESAVVKETDKECLKIVFTEF
ncbi:MAG: tRNA lysidine(34) synthetase TilS [Oscillospiraceae bacterium]|nr:tRNA lysidine(34) synthetase TilS [Oscillospiraceae bacterium]